MTLDLCDFSTTRLASTASENWEPIESASAGLPMWGMEARSDRHSRNWLHKV